VKCKKRLAIATEAIETTVFPNIGAIAAMLAKLNIVNVVGRAAFETNSCSDR
jgi:hypothetical protein